MRKIHDVLRLHFGLQLPQRQIARSVRLSQSTIHDYLGRFEQSGLTWPLPDDCDETKLEKALFGSGLKPVVTPPKKPLPDFTEISCELTARGRAGQQFPQNGVTGNWAAGDAG